MGAAIYIQGEDGLNVRDYLKWMSVLLLSVIVLIGCAPVAEEKEAYPVTKVIDGDTFKVEYEGREETIRLLLVDTPETVHPSKPVQPFGQQASDFLKKKLTDQRVVLELDLSERDRYGRILAYAYDTEGNMINEILLEKGLARVAYIFPPNTKYVDRFQAIQEKAREQEVGIWSIENYVTAEGFKSEDSAPKSVDPKCSIKGNINSDDEKIYHLPSGQYYERTKAEKMFCSEKEAEEAGFRRSKR
jgi:micrococcal nuclease